MNLYVSVDGENKRVDAWACLTSGCVRYEEGEHFVVELAAEKEGERVTYQAFGQSPNVYAIREEAARAIGTYILFSEYIAKQVSQQDGQQDG
jgi:hypothetical protein